MLKTSLKAAISSLTSAPEEGVVVDSGGGLGNDHRASGYGDQRLCEAEDFVDMMRFQSRAPVCLHLFQALSQRPKNLPTSSPAKTKMLTRDLFENNFEKSYLSKRSLQRKC